MQSSPRVPYRHGDLPAALLAAGTELARVGGPEAVVLREATRRVGVSPNAAYRHFADHSALLGSVRAVAMSELARAMETEQSTVPRHADPAQTARLRLRAVGAGYLRYARDEPGMFRTAFTAAGGLTEEDDARGDSGLTPFGLLNAALDDLVSVGLLAASRRQDAEMMAWSAVHGLSMLLINGPLHDLDGAYADRVSQQLLDHIEAGLLARPEAPTRQPAGRSPDIGPRS